MEVSHRLTVAICPTPDCGQRIRVSIGRWPGGINDRGGFVVECGKCHKKSHIAVSNPNGASSVMSGGRVVATWDDDMGDKDDVLAAHGLTEADILSDSMLVIPSQEPDHPLFVLDERAIYRCPACGDDFEKAAYAELEDALAAINDAVIGHHMVILKGYTPTPNAIDVTVEAACSCATHRVTFVGDYTPANPIMQARDFLLAGPDDPALLIDIDGVYSRNDCVEMFKKLLLRWRARHRVVLLVVPFIGFDFPGREADKLELWNMVLGHTDPRRTLLVTRRKTYNSFKETSKKQGLDLVVLKKYGLLAQMLEQLDAKGALFKTDSHAKFYAAVGPEITEVLTGSFNIHSGEYVENLLFKTYSTTEFVKRYLLPLGVLFDFQQIRVERDVLAIEVSRGRVTRKAPEKRV